MATHHGSFEELQAAVSSIGYVGEWQSKPNEVFRFASKDRSGLNWSKTKGTLWYDGPQDAKAKFQAALEAALNGGIAPAPITAANAQTIFVVHGHDSVAREQLELVLHKLGLQPFVLQNTDGGGLTIVESLEKMIGKNAASSFGIVLLTPDDMGMQKKTAIPKSSREPDRT